MACNSTSLGIHHYSRKVPIRPLGKDFLLHQASNSSPATMSNPGSNGLTSSTQLQIQHKGHRVIPNNHHKETSVEQVPKSSSSKNQQAPTPNPNSLPRTQALTLNPNSLLRTGSNPNPAQGPRVKTSEHHEQASTEQDQSSLQ